MTSIVCLDPINRDAHFLKLISEISHSYLDKFEVISTQRTGMELNSNIPFQPFFSEVDTINTGKISLTKKLGLISQYFFGFQRVADSIKPGTVVLYSSGMSLPELERIGIERIRQKAAKVFMLVHNMEDTQSKFLWLSQWRNRRLLEIFDGWIFLSNYMKEKAVERLKLPPEKTYVMLHPHFHPMLKDIQPDEELRSHIQQLAQGKPIIAYTSRADQDHGIDLFYKVLHDIQRRGASVYGVVLGRLSKSWNFEKNETLIKSYQLTSNQLHTKLGTYTYPELLAVLTAADCVLAPYRNISQSGAIALALGEQVPVIASRVGANSEMVKDGVNGLLFDLTNLNNLIDEIVLSYEKFGNMHQRFHINHSFNSHLDPNIAVSNMFKCIQN